MKRMIEDKQFYDKIGEPVDDLFLLQIMKTLCQEIYISKNRLQKMNHITDTMRFLTALSDLDNEQYRRIIMEVYKSISERGLSLKEDGQHLVLFAKAINACIQIHDSNSMEWKEALSRKLLETLSTLRKMLRQLKTKKENKHHRTTSPAIEVMSRSHRQRRESENNTLSKSVIENSDHSSTNHGH